jgi:hypothetical protein
MARELAPTTLIRMVAARLGSPRRVVTWLQSLPQSDDDGAEAFRYVACDVSQRVRLLPDDPNCFERAFASLALLEALDPSTPRMLVTIERPVRHTGVVEQRSGRWVALDLFPRRNFIWGKLGGDVLQGIHQYVGKPVLRFYGLGSVADQLGDAEDKLIGRDKKNQKKEQPPSRPGPQPAPAKQAPPKPQQSGARRLVDNAIGTGATTQETTSTKGGKDVETKEGKSEFHADAAGRKSGASSDGDDDPSSLAVEEEAQRWGHWG